MNRNNLMKLTKKDLVLMILCTERDSKTNFMMDSRYKQEYHPTMREDRDSLSLQIVQLRKDIKNGN